MDIKRYDPETADLINACLQQLSTASKKTPGTIRKLLKKADELSDNTLRGYAYYHKSLYIYYVKGDSSLYRPYLEKAMRCFLRANETDYLARAYNFVAVDAHNNGCLDIAYNYYLTSLRFSEKSKDRRVVSLVYANIGRLYAEINEYALARKYIRKGLRAVRKQKEDLLYYTNLIIIMINDGLISLSLNDVKAAQKTLEDIDALKKKASNNIQQDVRLPHMFFRVRYALSTGDKAGIRRLTKQLCPLLREAPMLQEFIDDLRTLCNPLIAARMLAPVGQIIEAVDDKVLSCGITYVQRIFAEIKVDYYDAKKDPDKLRDALYVQHHLLLRQRVEQRRAFQYSVDLINLVNDLWSEQEKIRKENTVLQHRAQTDTLTGIPNRYMMNKELESAFERAYKERRPLGIGILDIDYFKEYNDTYGHQAGDHCLEAIAGALDKFSRETGIFVARYGGDEFVLIYENKSNEEMMALVKKLDRAITGLKIRHAMSGTSDYVTISQGVCNRTPRQKNKLWDYLSEADAALYEIKKGRGAVKNPAAYRLVHD